MNTRLVRIILFVVAAVALGPRDGAAGPFQIADDYNVFVFGDIIQLGTDVEGRVAAGGNITYGGDGPAEGFNIASATGAVGPAAMVAGGNVTLTNGTVGGDGTIVYGGTASISPSVGYGLALNGSVIDFASEQAYLTGLSSFWGGLASNGTTTVGGDGNIELSGTDGTLNVFSLQASDITSGISFSIFTPGTATTLINISGMQGNLMNFGFFFNTVAGEPHLPADNPFGHVLFNFLDATDINIDQIAVNGSILAPYAHVDFGLNSHIDGHLIAASLSGSGESHHYPFVGVSPPLPAVQPVPEPGTFALLFSGVGGVFVWHRFRRSERQRHLQP